MEHGTKTMELLSALWEDNFDEVRRLTDLVDQDQHELLYKVGLRYGDAKFRKENGIDKEEAHHIFRHCIDELNYHSDGDKSQELIDKSDFN